MRRYLVVSNQTLSSEALVEKVRSCLATGPSHLHVLVPATHAADHMTWTPDLPRRAERRLGIPVTHVVAEPATA